MSRVILKNSLSENFWKFRGEGWWRVCSGRFLRNFSIFLQHSLTEDSPGDFLGTRCSCKFRKIYRKATVPELLFNKVATYLIKLDTPAQMPSREFCEIFENTFFKEHLRATIPEHKPLRADIPSWVLSSILKIFYLYCQPDWWLLELSWKKNKRNKWIYLNNFSFISTKQWVFPLE